MVAMPPVCDFFWKVKNFFLPSTDGKTYNLCEVDGPKVTVIMFICYHYPYVLSAQDCIFEGGSIYAVFGDRCGGAQSE